MLEFPARMLGYFSPPPPQWAAELLSGEPYIFHSSLLGLCRSGFLIKLLQSFAVHNLKQQFCILGMFHGLRGHFTPKLFWFMWWKNTLQVSLNYLTFKSFDHLFLLTLMFACASKWVQKCWNLDNVQWLHWWNTVFKLSYGNKRGDAALYGWCSGKVFVGIISKL